MDGDTAGAAVALDTLGSTVTTASGAFAVTVNLSEIAPQFHQGDGSINLETQVFSRATVTTYNTVIAATQVAAANADTETFDLGKQTVLDSNSIVVAPISSP